MGWVLGLGNGIVFRQGGSQNWSSYWTNLNKVLFFGEISKIRDGKLYNQVVGSSDHITVSGSPYTFQVPNTAPYITADTDYIWFKTDATQRTTTTAELIGYDLQRTPIKYDDASPYSIRVIMILKAGESLTADERNRLFRDMFLHTLWDNSLNPYGHIKGNRTVQQLWTPESVIPVIISDGNTVGWYDFTQSATITKDVSNLISAWADRLGGENTLLQADSTKQPSLTATGVLFGGTDEFLKTAPFAWSQPESIYMVIKVVSNIISKYVIDGNITNRGVFTNGSGADTAKAYAGASSGDIAIPAAFFVTRLLFNGASSKFTIGNTDVVGNFGTNNMGGLTVGAQGDGAGRWANVEVKEIIGRKIADTAENDLAIRTYLKNKYSL